ncbi:uncharacterized protein H6S33_011061 [Morchella sextelata]|uniref:uncharacterized protein n=1 Tax=Morchella sextelata TaxID=1174677 RepID=UPI001D05949A|nr:uncharacterized protein H6S33_011061 [Morchella sextelata]KAH0611796.1 hypothetical protein H6S33_011061 [Morchella sextelata]
MSDHIKKPALLKPGFEGPAPPPDYESATEYPLGALLSGYFELPEELRGGPEADAQLSEFLEQFKVAHAEQIEGKK